MAYPNINEACRIDLFTDEAELRSKYPDNTVDKILRIRAMHQWWVAHPSEPDRAFVAEVTTRYNVSKHCAYSDLAVVKTLLPTLSDSSKAYHRWRANEMLLETYRMAKSRKDMRTMAQVAASYAKANGVDKEPEAELPYDEIVVQPFVATDDPTPLGIKPMPNRDERVRALLKKYSAESSDIEDVEFEEADLELGSLFPDKPTVPNEDAEESLL